MTAILDHGSLTATGGFRPLRILVVDDDKDNADSWAMVLEAAGYTVDVAYSGPEALLCAQAEVPDVVMMDLGMPKQDGYAATKQVRAICPKKPLLIALSGFGRDADRRRSYAEGFDYHFLKPVDAQLILRVLAEYATSLSYH
jgi:CheY-like chemotaxis protein